LADLTGWKITDIRSHMNFPAVATEENWWRKLWNR